VIGERVRAGIFRAAVASGTIVVGFAALLVVLAAGCRRTPGPLTEALLATGGPTDQARADLDGVARRVEVALRARPGVPAGQVMSEVVFGELGFSREVDDPDPRFMRLPAVLADRRGSCYGLAALFVALGERLGPVHGFSVAGVLVPGHFFVRVTDRAGARNVELLRRGEAMPEAWYRQRYQVPPHGAPAYLRPLAARELLAVFDYNLGNDLRIRGRLAESAAAYARAARAFPDFAEAHASLGLVRHLLGALPEAMRAYQAARVANPHLPGLDTNIAVLSRELRAP
jgi:regulator of sirC expression with transglutaminase-like and TPR domain